MQRQTKSQRSPSDQLRTGVVVLSKFNQLNMQAHVQAFPCLFTQQKNEGSLSLKGSKPFPFHTSGVQKLQDLHFFLIILEWT